MPQETLFRAIVEVVLSVAETVTGNTGQAYWRIFVALLVAVLVVGVIWMTCEPSWMRTTFMIIAGVGIPIEGIRWHIRSGD